jgi:hypothetical protein
MGNAVNIIGKGKTWVDAPMDEYSWGITQLCLRRPVDLTIDMNVYDDGRWGKAEKDDADRARQLCETRGIPYIDIKTYPIAEIIEHFHTDYFSSTVDYAIALALYRDYKEIHLYGMTMTAESDYYNLKCGCDFWCGYAKGMGADVTVHGASTVMRTRDGLIYGYDVKQRPLSYKYR